MGRGIPTWEQALESLLPEPAEEQIEEVMAAEGSVPS
jgi:hypothetical protein